MSIFNSNFDAQIANLRAQKALEAKKQAEAKAKAEMEAAEKAAQAEAKEAAEKAAKAKEIEEAHKLRLEEKKAQEAAMQAAMVIVKEEMVRLVAAIALQVRQAEGMEAYLLQLEGEAVVAQEAMVRGDLTEGLVEHARSIHKKGGIALAQLEEARKGVLVLEAEKAAFEKKQEKVLARLAKEAAREAEIKQAAKARLEAHVVADQATFVATRHDRGFKTPLQQQVEAEKAKLQKERNARQAQVEALIKSGDANGLAKLLGKSPSAAKRMIRRATQR